jgi:hypothetical protein
VARVDHTAPLGCWAAGLVGPANLYGQNCHLISKWLRPVSMGSVTARFHILARHQDWNETIRETTPAMEHFTLLFPRLSKVFNCRKMIGSYARWWNDLTLNRVSLGYQSLGNSAYEFHHGKTLFFFLLSISYKTCLFADVSRY